MRKVTLYKRPNTEVLNKSIRRVENFKNALEIFENYFYKSDIDAMSENFKDFLRYGNDFDPITYFVVDNKILIHADSINGDVIGVQPLAEFMHDVFKCYKEEYNGEW